METHITEVIVDLDKRDQKPVLIVTHAAPGSDNLDEMA